MDNIKPFNFVEYVQNKASITLEADMKYQLFEKHGKEPNGYSWEKIFKKHLEKKIPSVANNISYDSEAGMFTCYGSKDSIKEAVIYLVSLYHNKKLLEEAISTL